MPSLSRFKIPPYRYFPTALLESEGPKHWAQMRLLQACERIDIPRKLWPKFSGLNLPPEYGFRYAIKEKMAIPPFNPLYESEAEWRARTHSDLEKLLDRYAVMFRERFQKELNEGSLTKIKPVRDTTPLDLRYEWAARRYCLRFSYKEMATDEHSPEKIRKAVAVILAVLELPKRK